MSKKNKPSNRGGKISPSKENRPSKLVLAAYESQAASMGWAPANDEEALMALRYLLSMVDKGDFPLIHNTVRGYVAEGKLSKDGERAYAEMVDNLLDNEEG